MLLKIPYIFLISFLIVFYSVVPVTMDKEVMSMLLGVVFFSLFLFFLNKDQNPNLKQQFLKHSSIFLLGYFIVHFQYYLDFLLGNVTIGNTYLWINNKVVLKSMTLSVIGLLSFLIGYLSYKKQTVTVQNIGNANEKPVPVNFFLFVATIALLVFFATVNPLYLSGFYGSEQMGSTATYAVLVFVLTTYAIIIQNCRNMILCGNTRVSFKEYLSSQGVYFISLLVVYLLSVLVSGDRGPIITIGIAIVSGYFIITKIKISLKYWLLVVVFGATLMTLLGEVRQLDKGKDFSEKLKEALNKDKNQNETSIVPQTQELAGSVRALHTTVDYIPEKHNFLFGRFQFQQISASIPFVSVFLTNFFDSNHQKYAGSASFVTWINQGEYPSSGDGTSCVADFYFDFGILGVIIGLFFFGYYLHFLEIKMYGTTLPGLFVHILIVVYLCNALYVSRSSILFELRTVVWVFLLLRVNMFVFKRK